MPLVISRLGIRFGDPDNGLDENAKWFFNASWSAAVGAGVAVEGDAFGGFVDLRVVFRARKQCKEVRRSMERATGGRKAGLPGWLARYAVGGHRKKPRENNVVGRKVGGCVKYVRSMGVSFARVSVRMAQVVFHCSSGEEPFAALGGEVHLFEVLQAHRFQVTGVALFRMLAEIRAHNFNAQGESAESPAIRSAAVCSAAWQGRCFSSSRNESSKVSSPSVSSGRLVGTAAFGRAEARGGEQVQVGAEHTHLVSLLRTEQRGSVTLSSTRRMRPSSRRRFCRQSRMARSGGRGFCVARR